MTIPGGQLRLFHPGERSGPRYGSLLVILIVTYLLSALTVGALVSTVQVVLFLGVVLIALRSGRFHHRTGQIIAVGLLVGTTAAAIFQLVDKNGQGGALASLWTALILVLAVFFIVRQVLAQPEITEQSIFGALSAYMMIGLIFSAVYLAMWKFNGTSHSFFANGTTPNTKLFQYFSFTTLTTLGYGDFTAVGDGGRAVAVLEAMVGQMFLATLVARLVAGFRWSDRAAARRGAVEARRAAGQGTEASGAGPAAGSGPGEPGPGAAPRSDSSPLIPSQASPGPGHYGPGPAGAGQRGLADAGQRGLAGCRAAGPPGCRAIRCRAVPGKEGLGPRPDPAEPAGRGTQARNGTAPGRPE